MRQRGKSWRQTLEFVCYKMRHIVASEKANSVFRYIVTQLETHLQSNKIFKCKSVAN
jgi:hypothetical protein